HECKMSENGEIIPPVDEYSSRVLKNLKASCDEYIREPVIREIPQQPDSVLPFHNLYLSFYAGAFGTALILQYAVTYAITREKAYGMKAKEWLMAAVQWDNTLFSFYTSARLMHAIIAGVYWIQDLLSDSEIEQAYMYLKKMCNFHEKQAMEMCSSKEKGGHANLYASGFGLACLALISAGIEPKAETWLMKVIEKYERVLLPRDADKDGTYQPDGNWSIEYAFRYKFIFLYALRLVTGRDMIKEYYKEIVRPVEYLRYAYMGDGNIPVKEFYETNENMLDCYQINTFGALYLRFASITRDKYLQWIGMSNPVAGRLHAYGYKVRGGHRFVYPVGYTDYLWYDPKIRPEFSPPKERAKLFPRGELAVLRTSFGKGLTLAYQGRRGNIMYASPDLIINKNGKPMLCTAPVKDSLPMNEANGPAAGGGEMERKGVIKKLISLNDKDILQVDGFLTRQKITLYKGKEELDIELSRRGHSLRQVSIIKEPGGGYVRLGKEGFLKYELYKNLNSNQGALQMEFRLTKPPSKSENYPSVLFSVGQNLKYMFGNSIHVGFLESGRLGVKFKDSEGRWLFAHLSGELPVIQHGFWHKITVYWKNFNKPGANPVCGIILGEYHAEARLTMPCGKPFQFRPNTNMWVGGAVQMPDSFANADIRRVRIYSRCPAQKENYVPNLKDLIFDADYNVSLNAVYAKGNGKEISGYGLEYRLHAPECENKRVVLHKGYVRIINDSESLYITGDNVRFKIEKLPKLRAGFAGQSFEQEGNEPDVKRIIIKPAGNENKLNFRISTTPACISGKEV
ncbi:MAG: hypothetical protein GX045_05375, partial [Clostridiaceae bacterium]|nr:hypothetical protein [Clostridiaceae bacterium]